MKLLLTIACTLTISAALGTHAQTSKPWPPEAVAFLESPASCSILIGGLDRAGDGADRSFSESLIKALTALGDSSPSAIQRMRSACGSGLAQPEPPSKEAL